MKVIFLKDVGGVGQRETVKDVSDGYALNYLIPKGLAVQATDAAIKKLEAQNQQKAKEEESKAGNEKALLQKLHEEGLTISVRVNDQGHPYQHVSAEAISRAIREAHGREIPKAAIHIAEPITSVGKAQIKIHLYDVTEDVPVEVRPI